MLLDIKSPSTVSSEAFKVVAITSNVVFGNNPLLATSKEIYEDGEGVVDGAASEFKDGICVAKLVSWGATNAEVGSFEGGNKEKGKLEARLGRSADGEGNKVVGTLSMRC